MVGQRAHHPAGGRLSQNISEGLTHAISHLALVGTCGGVLVVAASACAGLCAAGHTRLAPVRIVEIDTATHSAVSCVVRPARYTTAGTVMVEVTVPAAGPMVLGTSVLVKVVQFACAAFG